MGTLVVLGGLRRVHFAWSPDPLLWGRGQAGGWGGQPGPVGALGKPRDAGRSRGEAKCKAWTWTWGGGVRDFSRWGVLAPQSWGEPETPAFLFFRQQSAKTRGLRWAEHLSTWPRDPSLPTQGLRTHQAALLRSLVQRAPC